MQEVRKMRWSLLLVIPLIGACDADKVPDAPTVPARPEVVTSASEVAAPATAKPEPSSADTRESVDIEVPAAAEGTLDELPSERVSPPTRPKAASTAVAEKKVEEVKLPEPELDLSLPDEWSEAIEPADEATSMSLLPPLFESSKETRSLQMSGELQPGAAHDETLVDGAQLNFELKR
jgi:hypothetical protein